MTSALKILSVAAICPNRSSSMPKMYLLTNSQIEVLKQCRGYRPSATEGHSGAVPPQMTACAAPNESCAPPSEDCAPKKSTDSVLLECKPKPKTPKLVFTALEFVSKNCIFVIFVNSHQISFKFWDEDLFYGLHFRIHGKMQEF